MMKNIKKCRWCKADMPFDAQICTECGQWQTYLAHWVRDFPTIILSMLSISLAGYIFLINQIEAIDRIEIENDLEFIEQVGDMCDTKDGHFCDRKLKEALIIRSIEVKRAIESTFVGDERKIYLDRAEKADPVKRSLDRLDGELNNSLKKVEETN